MQEVVLLVFAHVLMITAVVTGRFVGTILSFKFHFILIFCCGIDEWGIILTDKWRNKQETRKLFWQYKLDAFVLHGLSGRVVDLEWT